MSNLEQSCQRRFTDVVKPVKDAKLVLTFTDQDVTVDEVKRAVLEFLEPTTVVGYVKLVDRFHDGCIFVISLDLTDWADGPDWAEADAEAREK